MIITQSLISGNAFVKLNVNQQLYHLDLSMLPNILHLYAFGSRCYYLCSRYLCSATLLEQRALNFDMRFNITRFIYAAAFLLASCKSHYNLVEARRSEYNINSSLSADSTVIKTYLPYKQKMEAQMSAVIGQSARLLTKSGEGESLLGNFFADAVTADALKIQPDIDFALPTTKGSITLSTMFELMPFENELVVLKLKGTDVEQLLGFLAQSGGQPVTNIKFHIINGQAGQVTIKGLPFDRNRTYYVLTSDYIANGGDNVKGLANPLERKVLGLRVRDALINYVKQQTAAGKPIDAQLDGRITKN
jgi:2',3'-cyclic-nucleotide 2'-phosphodiesterase (5'-nucleotidase family)